MKVSESGLFSLRKKFTAEAAGDSPVKIEPVKSIMLVGARTTRGADGVVCLDESSDGVWLMGALHELARQGIPVDPAYEISVVNIDPAFGGEDFLTTEQKADAVVTCFVFNPGDCSPHDLAQPEYRHGLFALSPHHCDNDLWYESALRTGAKVVIAIGGWSEINGEHFLRPEGKLKLMPSPWKSAATFLRQDGPTP
jgi:hypothetical protein